MVNYLSQYPLMSSKHLDYLDYLDWTEAVRMLVSKEHLTTKGHTVIRILKKI